jgi:hypothetical protein
LSSTNKLGVGIRISRGGNEDLVQERLIISGCFVSRSIGSFIYFGFPNKKRTCIKIAFLGKIE